MQTPATEPESLLIDPVCGMEVDPATDLHADYGGKTYYFCHPSCLERFTADPVSFLEPSAAEPVIPGAIYTCPMHPEVRQVGPGSCPKCGMALEPEQITLTEDANPELADMTRRFYAAAILGLPVMLIAMIGMVAPDFVHRISGFANWLQLALSIPVVFWAGAPLFARGWASIVHRSPNMFTLIALGIGAAFLYSFAATVAPGVFPEGFRMTAASIRTSTPRSSSPRSYCSVRCSSCARGRARVPRSRDCFVSRRRMRDASTRTANTMCRSHRCMLASCCV